MTETRLDRFLTELTGIELSRGGLRSSLQSFAERRAVELGFRDAGAYLSEIARLGGEERQRLLDVVSVPHTWFFRDVVQLEAAQQVLASMRRGSRPLSVWVPGCATGEDAFSLALLAESSNLPLRIVATDISHTSLMKAKEARYGAFSLRELPSAYLPFFKQEGKTRVLDDRIRRRVQFEKHNLMDPPLTTSGGWDLILCRNVVIYFSSATGARCAERLAQTLRPDGALFFGAGELVAQPPQGLEPVLVGERVAFRRLDASKSASPWASRAPTASPEQETTQAQALKSTGAIGQLGASPTAQQSDRPSGPLDTVAVTKQLEAQLTQATRSLEHGRLDRNVTQADRPEDAVKSRPDDRPPPASATDSWTRLLDHENFQVAAQEVLRASAQAPLDAELRMLSGIALYTAGDYGKSLEQLEGALLLNGKLWPAALYRGLCLDGLGSKEEARAQYARAEQLLASPEARKIQLPPSLQGLSGDLLEMVRYKARRAT